MDSFVPPDNVFDLLKCALCDDFLSVSPISLISEDGNQYKCGRCHSIKTIISTRAVIYEHVAKLMVFPCIFKVLIKTIQIYSIYCGEQWGKL